MCSNLFTFFSHKFYLHDLWTEKLFEQALNVAVDGCIDIRSTLVPPNGEILSTFLLPLGFESAFQLLEKGKKVYPHSVSKPHIKDQNLRVSFRLWTPEKVVPVYVLCSPVVYFHVQLTLRVTL